MRASTISRCLRSIDIISLSLAPVLSPPLPPSRFPSSLSLSLFHLRERRFSLDSRRPCPTRSTHPVDLPRSLSLLPRMNVSPSPSVSLSRYIPLARAHPLHPLVPSLNLAARARTHGGVASGRSVSRGFGFDTFEREERARFAHRVESRRSFPNAIPEICRRNLARSTGILHANSRVARCKVIK